MKWVAWPIGLLIICGVGVSDAAVQIEADGSHLTISAQDAPLEDVLHAIAAATGFSLYLSAPLSQPISATFSRSSVLDILEALLRDQSSLIRYRWTPEGAEVEEVLVLGPATPGKQPEVVVAQETPPAAPVAVAVAQPTAPPATPSEPEAAKRIEEALAFAGAEQSEAAREILADVVREHEDSAVRGDALAALAGMDTVPVDLAASAAIGDEDPEVRVLGLALLGEMARHDSEAREILRDIAEWELPPPGEGEEEVEGAGVGILAAALLEEVRGRSP